MDTRSAPSIPPPAIAGIALGIQRLLPGHRDPSPVTRLIAVGLGGTGVALAAGAIRSFRQRQTTIHPNHPEQASVLVTTGINSITRNPMYLGLCAGVLAHALWRRSAWSLLPAAGVWLWLDRMQIPAEEAALEELFGQDYRRYRAGVPRWIGVPGR